MFRADAAVEHDLQQHVAQLVGHLHLVAAIHRVRRLAGFLDHVLPQCVMGLRPVPRAPAGRAQTADDLHKVLIGCAASVVYADSRHKHGGSVVVVVLPVQFAKLDRPGRRARFGGVFQKIDRRLVVKKIAQPEFHIRSQIAVVNFRDDLRAVGLHAHLRRRKRRHRAQILRVHAKGNRRARRRVRQRHAAQHPERHVVRQRLDQCADGRVALRLADGVDKRLRLSRPVDNRARGQLAKLVEILRAVIQRVQRLKCDAFLSEPVRYAVPARAQQQRVRLPQRVVNAEGQRLPAVRPDRRYGYDMPFAVHYSLSALFSTLSMMKRGRRFVSL